MTLFDGERVTLSSAVRSIRSALAEGSIATANLDARLLVAWTASVEPEHIYRDPEMIIRPQVLERLEEAVNERLHGKSVYRIIGRRPFWTLELQLSAATLEPRPETELVVERVLRVLDARALRTAPLKILDVGVGSGAILLALLTECPNAIGYGSDLSFEALRTAEQNAAGHSLADRCHFICADHLSAMQTSRIDILVSNPPYIASADMKGLSETVTGYDPHLALDGGPDGISSYKQIMTAFVQTGLPTVGAWFEIGYDQEMVLKSLFSELPAKLCCYTDLSALPRCVEVLPTAKDIGQN